VAEAAAAGRPLAKVLFGTTDLDMALAALAQDAYYRTSLRTAAALAGWFGSTPRPSMRSRGRFSPAARSMQTPSLPSWPPMRQLEAGGDFRIDAPLGQGAWVGNVTEVEGRDLAVLLVRTFTD
jgi:hypothetical protein